MIDALLQAVAVFAVLYGSFEAGNLRRRALVAKLVGSVAQFWVAAFHGVPGLMVLTAVLCVLQIRSLVLWYVAGVRW